LKKLFIPTRYYTLLRAARQSALKIRESEKGKEKEKEWKNA